MASTIKVDNVQNQPGTNIIDKCGTTITLGQSGDTVSLASGASQTGFGKTGAVDWDTSSIKTATFSAVSGNGYFCNTAGGAFNITLPSSPSAGAIVGLKDYNGSFNSNNLTIDRNGSKLDGTSSNKALADNFTSLTLVYVDGTQGWVPVEEGTGFIGESFMAATGGTITTCGNCKIHKFTGPGTFCVSTAASCATNNVVSYIIVAGGGGGGKRSASDSAGGGGAGGFREVKSPATPYTASPLCGHGTPGNRVTVSSQAYPVVVGAGGTAGDGSSNVTNGVNSSFGCQTAAGGGWGGCASSGPKIGGGPGGSGGGGSGGTPGPGGTGNTPPTTPAQGTNGGDRSPSPPDASGGAGGGATVAGAVGSVPGGAAGGAGATTNIIASPVAYAGGGGSGSAPSRPVSPGAGGAGGGGAGNGTSGTVNTGGGGGGSNGSSTCGGAGGSGIVIIRYKYQ